MKKQNERKRKKRLRNVLKRLEGDLELRHAGIRVAENAVEEGNADLGKVMTKKQLDMNKLKMCQAQIAMDVKRKNELQLEVGQVEKKDQEGQGRTEGIGLKF